MDTNNRESYEQKRADKNADFARAQRSRGLKRFMTWTIVVVACFAVIFVMVKLAQKSVGNNPQATLAFSLSPTDQFTGDKNSKITLVEYADFQCPACGAYYPMVKKITEEYKDKILFVYRNFPLDQHANAKPAAYAAESAGKQSKYWQMHDMLFENQTKWSTLSNGENTFFGYASALGLNMEQFKKDFNSDEVHQKVSADYQGGISAQVNSTPTFFLNGKQIQPASYEDFKKTIDQALQGS